MRLFSHLANALPEAPWRQVVQWRLYAGPRNGLRLALTLDCGHIQTRTLRLDERRRLQDGDDPLCRQCTMGCYLCRSIALGRRVKDRMDL